MTTGTALSDTLYGGSGINDPLDDADTILAGDSADVVYGNGGNDLLLGELGTDTLYGGVGNDSVYGGRGVTDTVDSADALYGHSGRDWLFGNAGDDTLEAGDDADTLYGGLGNDLIYGGNTFASAGDSSDWIAAGAGSDTVYGNEGDDSIFGGSGVVDASDAADVIDGGSGSDILYGNGGNDSLIGGMGNDTLYGGAGADTLEGGEGVDVIVGDIFDDIRGGAGIDHFVLDASTATPAALAISDVLFATQTTSLLTIRDLEIGEVLKIINTGGGAVAFTEDANGNAVLTINGQEFATLEGVETAELGSGSSSGESVSFTVAESGTSGGGGTTGGGNSTARPVLSDLTNATFLENTVNGSAQLIDSAISFDDDNANLTGGNVTISYSTGGGAEDYLYLRHQGTGAGQIGFDGTTVTYAGTSIGTVTTNGAAGANLVISLNTGATPTAVDALLQNLTYRNTGNTPSATRDITVAVSDGALIGSATATLTVTAEAEATAASAAFDPATLNGTIGFVLEGIDASDRSGYNVALAGDVNGDGFSDVIVGALFANEAYLVFGAADGFSASLALSALNGTNGVKLAGIDAGDLAGYSTGPAGDVNGDGFDDIIIAAPYGDPLGRTNAGEQYVIFGKASGWTASLDLSTLNGTTGFRLDGVDASDRAGYSVYAAGDVNGDGYDDVLIGSPSADSSAGESYLVFGKASGWAASVDLNTLDGTTGIRFDGIDANDQSGRNVASAGDVNGDGLDDVIIGAPKADPGAHAEAGESYLVFGKVSGWAASLDLNTLNGTTGTRLDGALADDNSGWNVSTGGDINGDGYADLIIGAQTADAGGDVNSGQTHIVFGKASGWTSSLDLSALNGTTGFRIDGIDAGDILGHAVSFAGDVNGDGYADMLIGAQRGDPGGRANAGETYVIYGKASGWAAALDAASLTGTDGYRIDGIVAGDTAGYSISSAGDVNGDGFDDIIVGAQHGDTGANTSAGESYVIFGNNNSGAANAVGTSGADTINGSVSDDVFVGGLGNDLLTGFAGADVLKGANGDDTLLGHAGADRLYGGNGADTLDGGDDADMLYGDKGADSLTGGAGADKLWGDDGNDTLTGGTGADSLVGGLGNDVFFFAAGDSTITTIDMVTLNFDQDTLDLASAAADTVNTVAGVTANALADVLTAFDNTNMDQIGDANLIQVTVGTLAGNSYVILSTDGNATYDEGVDIFFQLIGGGTFTAADIV